jgi:chaperonin GroES
MKKFELVPIRDHVIVKPLEVEEDTAGIYVSDESKEKPQRGLVMAVGSGRLDNVGNLLKLEVDVGDIVVYSKYGGMEIKINKENQAYLILTEDDILAIDRSNNKKENL